MVAGIEETSVRALGKVVQVMPPRLRRRVDALATYSVPAVFSAPSGPTIDDLVIAQQNNVKRLAALISQASAGSRGCPPAS